MGLDSVELLVNVEDYFDISITDQEAESILTVRDFSECIYKYLTPTISEKCRSQILFYKLREYFFETSSFPKGNFKTTTMLSDIFPLERREFMWENVRKDFSLSLPKLTKSDKTGVKVKGIKFFGYNIIRDDSSLTDNTVRDFIGWILALNHEKFYNPKYICNLKDVEVILTGLIAEKLRVPVEEINPTSYIIRDFGID